jgi:hypothetical protein
MLLGITIKTRVMLVTGPLPIRAPRIHLLVGPVALSTLEVPMPLFRRKLTALLAFGLLLGAMGCDLTTTTATYPLGRLSAQVVDANNAGVQGELLDLYKVEAGTPILWRASITGSNGIGQFGASEAGVIAGEYFIRVRFTTQHELAPGESNDRPVTVNEGDDIVVTFRVVPKTIGGELTQIAVLSNFTG